MSAMRQRSPIAYGVVCLAAVALVGCGKEEGRPLYPVEGTVTYSGSPLPNATVTFQPEAGPIAFGMTDMDGHYVLKTGGQTGAVAGPAKVAVSLPQAGDEGVTKEQEEHYMKTGELPPSVAEGQGKSPIPEKYMNTDTSGLTFTVTEDAEKNKFDIPLQP